LRRDSDKKDETGAFRAMSVSRSSDRRTRSSSLSSGSSSWSSLDFLDSLSDTCLGCLLVTCALVFCGLIFVIVYAVNNPVCVSHEVTQRPDKSVKTSPDVEVNMSGNYQLILTRNYANYLLALEIPQVAATQIEKLKSENLSINQDEVKGTTIKTITPWITKSISFKFNEHFNVEYEEKETKGVINYFCTRPKNNIINCNSINPGKGWRIMFDYIFTKDHLINKSYFISKNVGMTKKYRRI